MSKAFLVVGPEGSGTRWVTSLFIAAGCYGDATHEQRLDTEPPPVGCDIVFRRSLPHNKTYPNLWQVWHKFDTIHLVDKHFILCWRDPYCVAKSQVKEGYAVSMDDAYVRINHAYRMMFEVFDNTVDAMFNYESAMLYKQQYVLRFMERFNLVVGYRDIEFKNGDDKYYGISS